MRFAGLGLQLGVALALFTWGGTKLDEAYPKAAPWFTILGALLGAVGGMATLVYTVLRDPKDDGNG